MVARLREHRWLVALLLLTFVAYAPSIGNDFVTLDDPLLVTNNENVLRASWQSVVNAFTSFDPELYIPLTLLSYQLQAWTLGMEAWHFHLGNILLHLGSVWLTYGFVHALTRKNTIALFVAAVFALHPVNSEAVLWISARKDLLAAFLALASLRAFVAYADRAERRWYVLSLVLALLALLSKVTAASLPLLLLLIPLARGEAVSKVWMKRISPFVLLSIFFGIVAIIGKSHVERESATAMLMFFRGIGFSLQSFVWPFDLSVMHIAHEVSLTQPDFLLSIAATIGLSVMAHAERRTRPLFTAGWLFFLCTLLPSLPQYEHGNGILYLGSERYSYLPSIGLGLMIASFVTDRTHRVFGYSIIVLCALFSLLILDRTNDWKDGIVFNRAILAEEPNDPIAHTGLGIALTERNEYAAAEEHFRRAIELKPNSFAALIEFGALLIELKRTDEAIMILARAVEFYPESRRALYNLGVAYQHAEEWTNAAKAYERTIALDPTFPDTYRNLATVYGELGRYEDALMQFRILATVDPDFAESLKQSIDALK